MTRIRVTAALLLSVSLGSLSSNSLAQQAGTNPSVTHLMQSYNLSKAEAQMRIDLQSQILALSEKLNTENDPAYADMFIQHEPVFKIVVMFADKSDRKPFLDSLDPKLRRYAENRQAVQGCPAARP